MSFSYEMASSIFLITFEFFQNFQNIFESSVFEKN